MLTKPNAIQNLFNLNSFFSVPERQKFNQEIQIPQALVQAPIQPVQINSIPLRRPSSQEGSVLTDLGPRRRLEMIENERLTNQIPDKPKEEKFPKGIIVAQENARLGDLTPQAFRKSNNKPLTELQLEDFLPGKVQGQTGESCMPFLGDVIRALFANCQRQADLASAAAWGSQIDRAFKQEALTILDAGKATCRHQVEKRHCTSLSNAVASCDIITGIQLSSLLQQEYNRCEQLTLIIPEPANQPQNFGGQLLNFFGNEITGALFRNIVNNAG